LEAQRQRAIAQKEGEREQQIEAGAAQLFEMLVEHRLYVLGRILGELFEQEPGGTTARLRGLGGASGVMTVAELDRIANVVLFEGLIPPGGEQVDEQQTLETP
jgi:hypothetical protein